MKWIVEVALLFVPGARLQVPVKDAETAEQARADATFQVAQRLPWNQSVVIHSTPMESSPYPPRYEPMQE